MALVVVEHQPSLKVVSECAHRLIAEEVLEEGEDALARCRIGRDGEDDAQRTLVEVVTASDGRAGYISL